MSLANAVTNNAFEITTDPVALARAHANLGELTGQRIESDLYQALARKDVPCAAEIIGPTGAGKSSCIMRVLRDTARQSTSPHEVLILNAGDAASTFADSGAFAHHLVGLIKSQDFRFATDVQDRLQSMGAEQTEVTDASTTHRGGVSAGIPAAHATYQVALQEAHEKRTFGASAPQARQDLTSILKVMREVGARPVVVIDDTDRFVDPSTSSIQTQTVDRLFDNGIRLLDELSVDFVVAVHPRFAGTSGYDAAKAKLLRTHLEIPYLLIQGEVNPIGAVLEKHLQAHDVQVSIGEIMSDAALAILYGAYGKSRDLRTVLAIAETAAQTADADGAQLVGAEHVSSAMQTLPF